MARRDNGGRTTRSSTAGATTHYGSGEKLRRSKGRARTRASGVKIIQDPEDDERRLKDQLTQMGLYATNTIGDGNCLFRALSDQFYGTPSEHFKIRTQVVGYLTQHESHYKAFVDTDEDQSWETHLAEMAKLGTYGGHLELNGFANLIRRPIKVIQPGMVYIISFEDESPAGHRKLDDRNNLNRQQRINRTKGKHKSFDHADDLSPGPSNEPLYIVYHQWEHYSSVRNIEGPHTGLPQIQEVQQSCQAGNEEQRVTRSKKQLANAKNQTEENDIQKEESTEPRESRISTATVKSTTTPNQVEYRDCSPTSARSTSNSSIASSNLTSPSITTTTSNSDDRSSRIRPPVIKLTKKQIRQNRRNKLSRQKQIINHQIGNHHHQSQSSHNCNHGTEAVGLLKELKV